MAPETQLIEATRAIVAGLTDHADLMKRAAKLRKLELKAEAMKPPVRPAENVVCIIGGRSLSEPTEAERRRAAVAELILSAITAERSALYSAHARSAARG